MEIFRPFNMQYSVDPPRFEPISEDLAIHRTLEQMSDVFVDQEAVAEILERENPTIARVYMAPYPGRVGEEYYMTKGHIHTDPISAPEIYITLKGQGKLVMQTREGETHVSEMVPGEINYIPSGWAHRTVNIGEGEFVFLGIFPSATKRDYSFIGLGKENFYKIVVERDGKPVVIDHPNRPKQ